VKTGNVKTVQGQTLAINASAAGVKVNNAQVIRTDIMRLQSALRRASDCNMMNVI
jgi:hypothetical protein